MLDTNHQKLADFIRENPLLAGGAEKSLFGGLHDDDRELLELFVDYAFQKTQKKNISTFEINTDDFVLYLSGEGQNEYQSKINYIYYLKSKGVIVDPPSPARSTFRIFAEILLDLGLGPKPEKTALLYETALKTIYRDKDDNLTKKPEIGPLKEAKKELKQPGKAENAQSQKAAETPEAPENTMGIGASSAPSASSAPPSPTDSKEEEGTHSDAQQETEQEAPTEVSTNESNEESNESNEENEFSDSPTKENPDKDEVESEQIQETENQETPVTNQNNKIPFEAPREEENEYDDQSRDGENVSAHIDHSTKPHSELPTETSLNYTPQIKPAPPFSVKKSKRITRMRQGGKYLRRLANRDLNATRQMSSQVSGRQQNAQQQDQNQAIAAQQQPPQKKKTTFMKKYIKSVLIGSVLFERFLS